MAKTPKPEPKPAQDIPQFDDVLKRMLSTPPEPKVKPKPAGKAAQKKGISGQSDLG